MAEEEKHWLKGWAESSRRMAKLVKSFDHEGLEKLLFACKNKSLFKNNSLINDVYGAQAKGEDQFERKALTALTLLRHRIGINFNYVINPIMFAFSRRKHVAADEWDALCEETIRCVDESGDLFTCLNDALEIGHFTFEKDSGDPKLKHFLLALSLLKDDALCDLKGATWKSLIKPTNDSDVLLEFYLAILERMGSEKINTLTEMQQELKSIPDQLIAKRVGLKIVSLQVNEILSNESIPLAAKARNSI